MKDRPRDRNHKCKCQKNVQTPILDLTKRSDGNDFDFFWAIFIYFGPIKSRSEIEMISISVRFYN
jgi:hypothetical protein